MKASGRTWDEASLRLFLTRPAALVPGTRMAFYGIGDAEMLDNVVAYLAQFNPDGSLKP